ncbi:FecCD family ABC transporter permease [Demequina sp.]|uniref:FecCD family ABC transporter permease n=1 Tax=Demequina sp. TaxID=2050685 RepID=UPI003D14F18B
MTAEAIAHSRRSRALRRAWVLVALATIVVVLFFAAVMVGDKFYGLGTVWGVITGQDVGGAQFIVGKLRLPRAALGVLAGAAFGVAGVTFQTMLRNPLASPDIIGIDAGAATAAVAAIVVFRMSGTEVSIVALVAALVTAATIYALSIKSGFRGTRLILIGIGIAAFLDSITSYLLSRAAQWDLQAAMRWLTGSLNNVSWDEVRPVALAMLVILPVLLLLSRDLGLLRMGDDAAAALGVRVNLTRIVLIVGAVALLAFATAACGPIAFVAFMAGPIASRIVGPGGSLILPAALVGAMLVVAADMIGQHLFDHRYPVGIVTGVLGAPFLLYLLIRNNRSGGSI